ncbi:MAG: acyltransferase family protein [Thermomicrobiales bacterium]
MRTWGKTFSHRLFIRRPVVWGTEHPYQHGAAPGRLPYLPGLDGLRALAVVAVLLYHASLSWLPGGFLGVDVFFVISGYLITGLLLAEWRQHGRLDLKRFWLRRARRLLPVLYVLLIVALAFAVLALPGQVSRLRAAGLAAFAYVTNWYLIVKQQSYFEAVGRPLALQHLWSLAIEEQFYLLWPPVLQFALRRWRSCWILVATLAAAALSTAWMAALYQPGVDPSRLYYGTDTHAAALLLGAALAFAWQPWQVTNRLTALRPAILDGAGFFALALLLGCFVRFSEFAPALYHGGFTLVALIAALVIAATVAPRARWLPALLELPPLRWLGVRSYSLYLWHWPIFVITRPQLDVSLTGLPVLALRLGLAVMLAALSYRFVETPIRTGALQRAWRAAWARTDSRSRRQVNLWSGLAGAGLGGIVALSAAVAAARPPAPPAYLATTAVNFTVSASVSPRVTTVANGRANATTTVGAAPTGAPPLMSASSANDGTPALVGVIPTPKPSPTPLPTCPPAPPRRITAIGDSVMVGSADTLAAYLGAGLTVNAEVGRQAQEVPGILAARRAAGELGDIVIIHIGTNGPMRDADFDAIMAQLHGVRAVIFVNVHVPREWQNAVNTTLAAGAARYQNALLIDWQRESAGHPEYFADDGIHLTLQGTNIYASMIATQVDLLEQHWARQKGCRLA